MDIDSDIPTAWLRKVTSQSTLLCTYIRFGTYEKQQTNSKWVPLFRFEVVGSGTVSHSPPPGMDTRSTANTDFDTSGP